MVKSHIIKYILDLFFMYAVFLLWSWAAISLEVVVMMRILIPGCGRKWPSHRRVENLGGAFRSSGQDSLIHFASRAQKLSLKRKSDQFSSLLFCPSSLSKNKFHQELSVNTNLQPLIGIVSNMV